MTMEESIPLQFQILYNGQLESIYKTKQRMYASFKVELNNTAIYRLIHYDFERHYISAGQLFKSCGLTITEGLFLFELKMIEFEVDFLISDFPYCDIWVSLDRGRAMASSLGVEKELELLLKPELDECFSSDNITRNEMMHNWIIPSIPTVQYSTRALLETKFNQIELLDNNRKVRTQISNKSNEQVMKDRTETGLVRWQVWAYEQFLLLNNKEEEEDKNNLMLLDRSGAIWDTLQGLLFDLKTMNRDNNNNSRVLSDNMMVGNMPLKKEYLGHSLQLQQLYISVMIEKIMNEFHRTSEEVEETTPSTETTLSTTTTSNNNNAVNTNILFHDRMDLLEQEIYKIKRRSKRKLEEIQTYQDELTQQINELNSWKSQSDRIRKNERVWMLMFIICVVFGVLSFRTYYLK